jgi:uncharacterized pyridoxamine 5'-phosphate oxidase family protein
MQDEILKHTEKIYKTAKNPQHSFREKFTEIVIEIFIIVFAVTLSIWLHGLSEHSHQKKEVREFLADTKDELENDLKSMQAKKAALDTVFANSVHILDSANEKNSAGKLSLNFSLTTFKANDGNYQGFKSSGRIGFIENKELKKEILAYYENTLPAIYDVDRYQYEKHLQVWEQIIALGDKQFFTNSSFRAKLSLDAQTTEALIRSYKEEIDY